MPSMPHIVWKPLVLTLLACICLADHSSLDAYQEAPAPNEGSEVAPSAIPLEESPLLFEPQTPEEHFDAVVTTVNLARLRLARQYLERFLALDPDEDTLLALRDKYGPAPFLNLANQEELRPLSQQLLDRVNAAVRRRANDPARIDALIDNLAGTAQQRAVAFEALRNTGPIVVPRILLRVAAAPPDGRDVLIEALTRLGRQAVPPLLGALESPNEDVRAAAITALGFVGSSDVAPYLWFPAFGPDQPTGLQLTARRALARLLNVEPDYVDAVTAFGVSDELRKLALQHYRRQHPWALEEGGGRHALDLVTRCRHRRSRADVPRCRLALRGNGVRAAGAGHDARKVRRPGLVPGTRPGARSATDQPERGHSDRPGNGLQPGAHFGR